MTDVLAETEKYIYARLYTHESTKHDYGWNSNVKVALPIIWDTLKIEPGDTLLDWGCGKGWAMYYFDDMKVRTTGIDITGLGIIPEVRVLIDTNRVDFVECPVWDVPESVKPCTWSLASSLLTQVPEDKLDAIMENIQRLTTKGVCFIQTVPVEYMGGMESLKKVGVEIKFSSWTDVDWIKYLDKYFDVVLGDFVPGAGRKRFYFIWGETKDR